MSAYVGFKTALIRYLTSATPDQADEAEDCLDFACNDHNCFLRENAGRHFTGSSLIVDRAAGKTLLVKHLKYGRWVQTGGHCDGRADPFYTALEEAYQESGLRLIEPDAPWVIFDVDVQSVPEYQDVPEHVHYDIRYLFTADSTSGFQISEESTDIGWFTPKEVAALSPSPSLVRMIEKVFGEGCVSA